MTNTSGRAVSLIERIGTQASRLEELANAVGTLFGINSTIYEKLVHEMRVSKSILAQAQDEATTKVEEKAKEPGSSDVPEEVDAIMQAIEKALKEAGLEASIIPVPIKRGPFTPMSIRDILNKL